MKEEEASMTVAKTKDDFDGILSLSNKYLKANLSESEISEGFVYAKIDP